MACSLSSHVLDTTLGTPGRNMKVTLSVQDGSSWKDMYAGATDDDGRIKGDQYPRVNPSTVYKITFHTDEYFSTVGVTDHFFPYVDIVFKTNSIAGQHYHVPLLISPFQYSTYRGS